LEGRIAVEWGESGTEVLFRATIKAPTHEAQLPAPAPAAEPARVAASSPGTGVGPEDQARREDVIEGEAHTVEIDVSDLKALIAAVETAEAQAAEDEPAREFRLHRTPRGMHVSDPR
ncbi:MAG TPA: hypothetical protein VE127_01165, partial [Solirubrobacteraceae bacterium]|nr:hypothetical protein [Solirubrobacteraceae bacterium]